MNTKPIILIDDDHDDLESLKEAFSDLGVKNEIIVFDDGYKFLDFIRETNNRAFFIICDVNMSKINGLKLKETIHNDEALRLKCVPFIFMSNSGASTEVLRAYSYGVQGYFVKPTSFVELKQLLSSIVTYWESSQHPI